MFYPGWMAGKGDSDLIGCLPRPLRWVALLALFLIVAPLSAMADVAGPACVEDGDTLVIDDKRRHGTCRGGTRVHLFGIDAPELEQTCTDGRGAGWRCGQTAASMLLRAVRGKTVACEGDSRDADGDLIAVCRVDGEDISRRLVRIGAAVADRRYSKAYVDEQEAARSAKSGIWRGAFTMPWDWRAGCK